MAGSASSSQDRQNPSAPQPPPSSSRRLPPPCWTHDETVALIDAYREKWYSLRRGNLKAFHWQEVAEGVANRCPPSSGSPQKTSVQCRHKMEKLRKRYRGEMQRAVATPAGRHRTSSWVHFNRMDSMEKAPASVVVPLNTAQIDEDDEGEEDSDEEYQEKFYPKSIKNTASHSRTLYGSTSNGINGNGVRIRIPGSRSNMEAPLPTAKIYTEFVEFSIPNPNPNFGASKNFKDGYNGRFGIGKSGTRNEKVGKRRENDPAAELVAAIKGLGDGFLRMERMKMEMAREVEAMRMDMEIKRTQMILESQQRIVESFVKAITESQNKKAKRMLSPES